MTSTGGFDHDLQGALDKAAEHEQAAHEKRQWVRLTNLCNNKCVFCLDSAVHDGTYVDPQGVRELIAEGREGGATRLILSGGEPTIHPEYLDFIALGHKVGYRRVQTVTNGRMFAYPEFLRKCVNAGLQEITFSVHGHNAKVHDALVGVPGAYVQIIAGVKNALADGRVVVNVDVCLNRANVPHLRELLDGLIALGVSEIDLLHIIPFGDAYRWGKDTLFYDIDEAWEPLRYALELSRRPDLHIWFNRFPPPFLEGWEHLIQDPHKLTDEVRGRLDEYEWWIRRRWPLLCRKPDRCDKCYLQPLCDGLEQTLAQVDSGDFSVIRAEPGDPVEHIAERWAQPGDTPEVTRVAWIRARDISEAAALAETLPGDSLWLDLESYDGWSGDSLAGRPVSRVFASRPEDLESLLSRGDSFEVTALLLAPVAEWLASQGWEAAPARLSLALRTWERASEAREHDADLGAFFAAFPHSVPVEGVPRCLSGRVPRPSPRLLDLHVMGEAGQIDPLGYTDRFIRDGFHTKSRRCSGCAFDSTCAGVHINWVRAHGYGALTPQ